MEGREFYGWPIGCRLILSYIFGLNLIFFCLKNKKWIETK